MCEKSWDVIVVGGGPAGLAAAITARQKAFSTLLIDHRELPTAALGKCLHPGIECILKKLDVWEAFCNGGYVRNTGHYAGTKRDLKYIPYRETEGSSWTDFTLYGTEIQSMLKDRFKRLGGTFLSGIFATDVIIKNNCISGVWLRGKKFPAKLVIDATGSQGFLKKRLDIRPLYGSPRLFATYCLTDRRSLHDEPTFLFNEHGWRWSARLSDGRLSQVMMDLNGRKHLLKGMKAADVTWRFFPACAGSGYALVGDAAIRIDPARGGGVLRALLSGIWAIALFSNRPQSAAARSSAETYRTLMTKWAFADGAALAQIYAECWAEPSWPQIHCWSSRPLSASRDASGGCCNSTRA